MDPLLTGYRTSEHVLASLVAAAAAVLAATGRVVGDERVTSAPDARTIRYYQQLGVVDRPLRHDGREAVYGYRHLLQAVATKLLQAEGYSLAQVQRALAGRSTGALELAVAEALSVTTEPTPPVVAEPAPPTYGDAPDPSPTLLTRELAPGVLVTLDPRRVSDPEALLARIRRALSPTGGTQ